MVGEAGVAGKIREGRCKGRSKGVRRMRREEREEGRRGRGRGGGHQPIFAEPVMEWRLFLLTFFNASI